MNFTGLTFFFFEVLTENEILYAKYIKKKVPRILIISWIIGYFIKVAVSDVHILLDRVQFTKNNWINRNIIDIGQDGAYKMHKICLDQWASLTGGASSNSSDSIVFNTRGWLANPNSDFSSNGSRGP